MKRSEKLLLGVLVVGVIFVVAFFAVRGFTSQRRDATLAKFEFPEYVVQAKEQKIVADNADMENVVDPSSPSYYQILHGIQLTLPPEWTDVVWKREHPEDRSDDYWVSIDKHLKHARRGLAQLRERAALGGPIVELDLFGDYYADMSHVSHAGIAAQALAVEADLAMHEGNVELAVANVVAMVQLGSALATEATFYSQHMRFTVFEKACNAIEYTLPVSLDPAHAAELVGLLAHADFREAFADSYAGQVLIAQSYIRKPEKLVEHRDDWAEYLAVNDPVFVLYNTPLGAPLRDLDESTYIEMCGRMRDAAHMPYYQASPIVGAIEREIEDLPPTRRFSRGNLQPGNGWFRLQGTHEARVDLVQLGLTIEQYYVEHDAYPLSLDAIAGELPDGLPIDPLSGQPYTYRAADTAFTLYSIGWDGTDDGGRMYRRDNSDVVQGDIVWRGVVEHVALGD